MRHSVHSIFFDQADAHEAAGRYHEAIALLYQVHRWAPEDAGLWRRMGVLSFLMADRDWLRAQGLEGSHLGDMGAVNADLYLARAQALAPGDPRAAFWRGWVRLRLYQDLPGARAHLGSGDGPYAAAALARVEVAEAAPGYAERALAHLDAAIATLPESARFHFDRGALLAGLGRADDARAAFARARAGTALPAAAGAEGQHLAAEFHGDPVSLEPLIVRITEQLIP